MKNRGFTLVELLAVIVILAIILAVAIPTISVLIEKSRLEGYKTNEKMLLKASKIYLASNSNLYPADLNYASIIKLDDLITLGYLNVKDVKDGSTSCQGYVSIVKMNDVDYLYNPYIKCGTNYQTVGFDAGALTANKLLAVEVLIVAGGGGGGGNQVFSSDRSSGGGGAGGLLYFRTGISNSTYSIVVGAGGLGQNTNIGNNGSNSIALGYTAIGGGGGGGGAAVSNTQSGASGGSGGGGGYTASNLTNGIGGTGISGQGYNGGTTRHNGENGGSGGGGAGQPGEDGLAAKAGNGGNGLLIDISGTPTYYAGGGGGAGGTLNTGGTNGIGGLGGGGNAGQSGVDGTGGGGGGGGTFTATNAGNGGAGIVIVRYYGVPQATGGTITSVDGYTIVSVKSFRDF